MQPAAHHRRSRHPACSAPPVTSRSNREQAHCVLLARRLAGKSGTSPEGRTIQTAGQLKVPGSTMIGAEEGDDIMPPPSPHEPHAGPQAGSCIGAPQAGWQGWGCGAAQGAAPPPQGERNSMNDGRRQLFAPPKQLLQPGAAARLPRAITRHRVRHMIGISTTVGFEATRGRTRCVVRDDAYQTLAHDPQHGRTDETISPKNFPAGRSPRQRPCRWGMNVAIAPALPIRRPCARHDSPPEDMIRCTKTRATVENSR
jgi:hypothetical protein